MLNSDQWQHRHQAFINESQGLMQRCEDCMAHLEMIADDDDAIACLQASLLSLSAGAANAALGGIAEFTGQLQRQLDQTPRRLSLEAWQTLRQCLGLLAWQLELIDRKTGTLALDDHEQKQLLERLRQVSQAG